MSRMLPMPDDGRDWIGTADAAALLGYKTQYIPNWARKHGLEMRQHEGKGGKLVLLRAEVESMADLRNLRRRWLRQHAPYGDKRQTERMDADDAKRIFCKVAEAAQILGVSARTVHGLVLQGRLYSYQSKPGVGGSRLWFSRRTVELLRDDPEWQARRARVLRSRPSLGAMLAAGRQKRERGAQLDAAGAFANRHAPSVVPVGAETNWLNASEAAALLGISVRRVSQWRQAGRLEGRRIGRKAGHGRWHFRETEIREQMANPAYQAARAQWEGERAKQTTEDTRNTEQTANGAAAMGVCDEDEASQARRKARERAKQEEERRRLERIEVERLQYRRAHGLGGHPGGVW